MKIKEIDLLDYSISLTYICEDSKGYNRTLTSYTNILNNVVGMGTIPERSEYVGCVVAFIPKNINKKKVYSATFDTEELLSLEVLSKKGFKIKDSRTEENINPVSPYSLERWR